MVIYKEKFVATFSNHLEILALHETNRGCIWLLSLIHYIQSICNLTFVTNIPIVIFEENAVCMAKVRGVYIKRDRTFYTLEFQHNKKIDVKQIRSTDNFADLFTKVLPTLTFEKLVQHLHVSTQQIIKLIFVSLRGNI